MGATRSNRWQGGWWWVLLTLAVSLNVGAATTQPASQSQPVAVDPQRLAELKAQLVRGDSKARQTATGQIIGDTKVLFAMDDSFIEALAAAGKDPDAAVRKEVARITGSRWIWGAKPQHPQAIAMELELAGDADAEVRYTAVYFGLSTVERKSEEVVGKLMSVAMAGTDYDPNLHGRIVWGLRMSEMADRLGTLIAPYIDQHEKDPARAMLAYVIYRRATGQDPPNAQRLDNLGVFIIEVGARPAAKLDARGLAEEIGKLIPAGTTARITTSDGPQNARGAVLVYGLEGWRAVTGALRQRPQIAFNAELMLVPQGMLKQLEERFQPIEGSATRPAAVSYEQAFRDLYETVGRKYPCFEMKGIDWAKVGRELLPRAAQVKTDREFGLLCLQLVAAMEDSHAVLRDGQASVPRAPLPQFDPGLACLIDDRGRPVVYVVDEGSAAKKADVKVGMTVVSVNGQPAEQAMEGYMKLIASYYGYSSQRCLQSDAARQFLRQMERGSMVKLVLEDLEGQKHTFELPADYGVRYLPRLPVPVAGILDSGDVSCVKLAEGIGYIYVRRIPASLPALLDKALRDLGEIRGLVIDVRGNSGGGFSAESLRNFDPEDKEQPERPRYKGRIALLMDERCISAGEGWASWFIARQRARTFGATTAGASSRKETYTLSNGMYQVVIPVKAYTGFLDRPIERKGLEPDVPVRCTARDLAAGRDTVREAAVKWLTEAQ